MVAARHLPGPSKGSRQTTPYARQTSTRHSFHTRNRSKTCSRTGSNGAARNCWAIRSVLPIATLPYARNGSNSDGIDLGPTGASLAEIGLELAHQSDVPTGPADRGHLPLFDPARFVAFTGDGTIPNASGPFDPVRLEIPKIQLDAQIEITTVQDGIMTNPHDPWKAGWYASFSRPGEWTNTVIAGHRDWWGYGPVVFWNLGQLQPGDKIYLLGADGSGATYVVNSNSLVPSTVDPQTIINDIGYEALTLITCGGTLDRNRVHRPHHRPRLPHLTTRRPFRAGRPGKDDGERRTGARHRFHFDLSPMGSDDGLCNRQTEPRAATGALARDIGAEKAGENSLLIFR